MQLARDAAPASLKTVEGFLVSAPKNADLLSILAQGFIEYSFGFLEDDYESLPDDAKHSAERDALAARATGLYDRAQAYAIRLLELDDKHFGEMFRKDVASAEAEAKKLDKKDAPGLLVHRPRARLRDQLEPQRPGARGRAAQGDRAHQALARARSEVL